MRPGLYGRARRWGSAAPASCRCVSLRLWAGSLQASRPPRGDKFGTTAPPGAEGYGGAEKSARTASAAPHPFIGGRWCGADGGGAAGGAERRCGGWGEARCSTGIRRRAAASTPMQQQRRPPRGGRHDRPGHPRRGREHRRRARPAARPGAAGAHNESFSPVVHLGRATRHPSIARASAQTSRAISPAGTARVRAAD